MATGVVVAAVVFVGVAWSTLGVPGQVTVLGMVTLGAAGVASCLSG
ncbi:MAG: hypothetical protein ACRDYU_13875 [Actinomycetes bacterium]